MAGRSQVPMHAAGNEDVAVIRMTLPVGDNMGICAFMLTPKLQQLAKAKAKVERLEKSLQAVRDAALRNLHLQAGFATREELIEALRASSGGAKPGRKPGRPAAAAAAAPAGGKKRKKRVEITKEMRDGVIAAAKAGETGGAIAKKFGISLPSVQNIKKAAGLTKKRKGK
jgi:hypothetical protein